MQIANNGLNVLAVCMGANTVIYKIDFTAKKLEQLQRLVTDFSPR
jgi:hypothetical protein